MEKHLDTFIIINCYIGLQSNHRVKCIKFRLFEIYQHCCINKTVFAGIKTGNIEHVDGFSSFR